MPITKSDTPNLLLAGIKLIFAQAFAQYTGGVERDWASVVPSSKDTESYAWLGANPAMREFIEERVINGLSELSYSLKNKTWETTLGVDRAAVEDDQYGQIRLRVQQLAAEAATHVNRLIAETLAGGTAALCYDGQYFFDTDHSSGSSGTQSNLGTSALSMASLETSRLAMRKFKDDKGRTMNVNPNLLVVPPDLESLAIQLTQSNLQPGSSTNDINALKGKLDVAVSPFLTDTNNWYLLDTKLPLKPLIFQDRMPVEFTSLESNSESGFMRDQYMYGVRARYNVGYGPWQFAYCNNVT